jgi:ATP-binding cassette subfamily C protein LapB
VLLLDEPSSSLDRQAEQELRKTLVEIGRSRTVIMITHSPILLAACDDLVALDRGKVALAGPSKEILPKLFGQSPKPKAQAAPPAAAPPGPQAAAAKPAAPKPAPQAARAVPVPAQARPAAPAPPRPPGAVAAPPSTAPAAPRPSTADPSVPGGKMFRLKDDAASPESTPAQAPSPSDDPYADLIDAARGPAAGQPARPKQ